MSLGLSSFSEKIEESRLLKLGFVVGTGLLFNVVSLVGSGSLLYACYDRFEVFH
jgi:hypothetical protein